MDKRALTTDQLQEHLRRQLRHLHNSARLFDEGDEQESVRLATTVRLLVHHLGSSKALLVQMGLRDTIQWVDSCRYREDVDAALRALIEQRFGPESGHGIASRSPGQVGLVALANDAMTLAPRWAAPLDTTPITLSAFADWWARPGIETSCGATFSREQLVRTMANQDGGAHVDPSVSTKYDDFRSDFLGVQYAIGDHTTTEPPGGWLTPEGNVADASMRQIAWEAQETLHRLQLPWLA